MSNQTLGVFTSGGHDADPAYLFVSRTDPSKYAVTRDRDGANLTAVEGGWVLQQEIALGVRDAMPIHLAPEPVLRGLKADGFFIWHEGSNPKGTSQ